MNKTKVKKVKKSRFTLARVVIFLVIVAITIAVGVIFKLPIESALNKSSVDISNTAVLDENGLSVHFVDVGQGDGIAIKFPDGKTMLVDAGTTKSANSLVEYLNDKFFENDNNVFDYLLLTHSDADHCGGMEKICENFVVDKIYRPYSYCVKNDIDETNGNATGKTICTSQTYYNTIKAFYSEISSSGVPAEIVWTSLDVCNGVDKIEGIGYSIDFYSPATKYITKSAGTIANDYSPIMVLNYNGKKIMLTGDASTTAEETAMKNFTLPDVDLLKVGHHGSKTSSGEKFLNQIKPEIAVISVGTGNSYEHPTTEALNRLTAVGAVIYRTDLNGTVVANVTSGTTAELNIFVNVQSQNQTAYIRVEYLMAGIILLAVTLCFGIKIKV